MLAIGKPLRTWMSFLLLASLTSPAHALHTADAVTPASSVQSSSVAEAPTTVHPATVSSPPTPSTLHESTCAFRTINHITHTLLQQCLTTSWSAPAPNPTPGGGDDLPSVAWAGVPWAIDITKENASAIQAGTNHSRETVYEIHTNPTAADSNTASSEGEPDVEADSPLDNANFLSFEDWKKRNLAKAGQSPENVGQGRTTSSEARGRRRPVNINALDSLGEESEIDIDFTGFGQTEAGESATPSAVGAAQATKSEQDGDNTAPPSFAVSKDAGKTCKERFNYASFDCAATVLKTNNKAKSASAVLLENKDSYMLNECSAENKFIIVELCDDILVDTVVLANYEFFSSMFRQFRVSVSDRYPVKLERWRVLGTFEARNTRDIQPFLIEEPQIWARYLRIEFLSHYGNEFYCPLSLLRVHGTTMMEQFRREEEQSRGEDDFEPIEAVEGDPVKTAEAVADQEEAGNVEYVSTDSDEREEAAPPEQAQADNKTLAEAPSAPTPEPATAGAPAIPRSDQAQHNEQVVPPVPAAHYNISDPAQGRKPPAGSSGDPSSVNSSQAEDTAGAKGQKQHIKSPQAADNRVKLSVPSDGSGKPAAQPPVEEPPAGQSTGASAKSPTNSSSAGTQAASQRGSHTQPSPSTPTTQESFYKSIHKRLQQLEANSTLSLLYIEEQSRILRDAFVKVEKRQLQKTEKFLDTLNRTVMQELKSYKSMYEQLWESTIMELVTIKERQKSEVEEIGARLNLVADELVWQKRMAVVQSTLLLLCLVLVLFVRSGTLGAQSDMPIAQQLGKTYSRYFDSPPRSPEPPAGLIRRRRTFRNMWRSDASIAISERSERSASHLSDGINASDIETDGNRSPMQVAFRSPNTPSGSSDTGTENAVSPRQPLAEEDRLENQVDGQPDDTPVSSPLQTSETSLDEEQARRIEVLETQSGPATPLGSRDARPSWEEVDRAVERLTAEERGAKGFVKRSPLSRTQSLDDRRGDGEREDAGA
ncbi:hypothetical protein M011DRAFT_464893 [Sporormia fimetaria CBS 119925]|uniref:SUN domain-containing protein n=1 Tax=Sporormia fimetaria CBS 119925 TaxID=1340428 RepID=A0A6A6VHI5_9PLEO|nr:hypothetical protein M011DRAFT_464893 [Sporormia fimetaria CBS 119925]